jgi:hypothetical protein
VHWREATAVGRKTRKTPVERQGARRHETIGLSAQQACLAMKTPQHPSDLDEASRRDIEEAQAAMRVLIALIPRNFGYADEIDLVFRPYYAQ